MYSEHVPAIHIAMQFKKNRDIVYPGNKNWQPAAKNQNRSFTSCGATVGLGPRLWFTRSLVLHGVFRFSEI